MIIDCHGHYTTAPEELNEYRRLQVAACECGGSGCLFPAPVAFSSMTPGGTSMRRGSMRKRRRRFSKATPERFTAA